ncbi:MAG TPA: helix-turn-helix domain-containing protein [Slackia equolifaciens]|uniref:Helix-turn-helix domain-containing protein n=1 Tax=Slackia equolifaciens TaxID=498718 RepID=A0A9D3A2C4_9ACTN|nr:helix-turn-helix domain-containing protein [Slackia equolifaciens]
MNFGDVLRQARERSGEDIVSVARRIRIRPDILERIEASDLDGMPPRGYSRNMINAYARYLGLNPTEVVKMYLDAQYRSQVEKAREQIKPTGFDMSAGRRRGHNRETVSASESRAHLSSTAGSSSRRGLPSTDDEFFGGASPTSIPPAATTRRIGAVHVGSYNAYGQGLSQRAAARAAGETRVMDPIDDRHSAHSTHRARRSALSEEHYGNLYAAPSNLGVRNHGSGLRDKLPFFIAGIVILLLVVVIVVMVNGMNRAATTESTNQPMNITGMPGSENTQENDSSSGGDSTSDQASQQTQQSEPEEVAPTKTTIEYEVADGQTPYIEIWEGEDNCIFAGDVTGPAKESYDVTGQFQIVSSPYEGLTVTQDGEKVNIEDNVSSGIFRYSVDFQDVLDAWNEEHKSSSSDSGTDSASDGESANDASSGSTSDASA